MHQLLEREVASRCNLKEKYMESIGVGEPAQHFYIIMDTGSDVTWVQCKPCFSCYKKSDPIFDPSASSSYAPVPCGAKHCKESGVTRCYKNQCEYDVAYADGSYSIRDLVAETVSCGSGW